MFCSENEIPSSSQTNCRSKKKSKISGLSFENLVSLFQFRTSQVPQIININPTHQTLREGETCIIEAFVSDKSFNSKKTTWFKAKRPITDNQRYSVFEYKGIRKLLIPEVGTGDSGTYRIVLENSAGKAECSVKLDVIPRAGERRLRSEMKRYANSTPGNSIACGSSSSCFSDESKIKNAGRPPSVTGPSNLIAISNETVVIRIKYSGYPQPRVEWTKNGKPENLNIVENSGLSSVRIDKVGHDHSGRYIAKISNDYDTIFHHCILSVEDPLGPPSNPTSGKWGSLLFLNGTRHRFRVCC